MNCKSCIRKRISEDIENKIIEEYLKGEGAPVISKELNVSCKTVYNYLKRNGIERRKREEYRINSFNVQKLLDFDNPETQYWLGFIYADGHLRNSNSDWKGLQLILRMKDQKHLERFMNFIEYTGKMKVFEINRWNKIYKECKLHLYSGRLVSELISKGFSKTKISEKLLDSFHFWRGIIDGDGWLGFVKEKRFRQKWSKVYITYRLDIGICGNPYIISKFDEFLVKTINKHLTITENSHFYLEGRIYGRNAYEFGKLLYNNATIFLERKKEIFDLAQKYYERDVWKVEDFEERYRDELERIAV